MSRFADTWNSNNRQREARQKAARTLPAHAEPEIEITVRKNPVRVAQPMAIKEDKRPTKSGFSRSELIADSKAARKY